MQPEDRLRQKMAQRFRKGDYKEARRLARKILASRGSDPALWDADGLCALFMKDPGAAVRSFQRAIGIAPRYADAHHNLATALKQTGRLDEAVAASETAVNLAPTRPLFRRLLADLLAARRDHASAARHYATLLEAEPADTELNMKAAATAQRLGDRAMAETCHRRAVALSGNAPAPLLALARFLDSDKRYREALGVLEPLVESPGCEPAVWLELAQLLIKCGEDDKAEQACTSYFEKHGDPRDAATRLAWFCERNNLLERSAHWVMKAMDSDEPSAELTLLRAVLYRRGDQPERGLDLLEEFGNPPAELAIRWHFELGRLCDRVDAPGRALAHFHEGNRLKKIGAGSGLLETAIEDDLERMEEALPRLAGRQVPDHPAVSSPRRLAFLVGFPRSGTTLLNRIRACHSKVVCLEEEYAVDDMEVRVRSFGDFPGVLERLTAAQIQDARECYAAAVDRHVHWAPDHLLVDKIPLNLVRAPLLRSIFPEARFLFCLRHPYDVVLSCYMQDFELNATTARFLDLAETVRFYDTVMRFWEACLADLDLPCTTIRHEALVNDFDAEIGRVLEHLGLPREDGLRAFHERQASRSLFVNSASYQQVSRPIDARSVERWRRYREQLLPHLEPLSRWAAHYGYAT